MSMRVYKKKKFKQGDVVLMRIDANVPIKHGKVMEHADLRLQKVIPEIDGIAKLGVRLVLMTHIGRPEGKRSEELSTKPLANFLSKQLKKQVVHSKNIVGSNVQKQIEEMRNGDILMLENLRFNSGEEKDAVAFAKELASLGDIYINNAFGVSHREHASVHAVTRYIDAYAGQLLQEEVDELSKKYRRRAVLVVGGMKLETKIPVIEQLLPQVDDIVTAGVVAVALISSVRGELLQAGGYKVTEQECKEAGRIRELCGGKLHVPVDFKVATTKNWKTLSEKHVNDLGVTDQLLDIGQHTVDHYKNVLTGAKTIIWNGPMGYVEKAASAKGTEQIGQIIASSTARTVVGGGDSVTYLSAIGLINKFSFVSTGGGAMLAFLGGEPMPGIDALTK